MTLDCLLFSTTTLLRSGSSQNQPIPMFQDNDSTRLRLNLLQSCSDGEEVYPKA